MNFDEKMAEEYEEKAEYIEIDDYGHRVYGSPDIKEAYLAALRKGSQLDKVWCDASEDSTGGKWVNRDSELEKKYDICLRENTGLKIHNTYIEKRLSEAKEIIRKYYKYNPSCEYSYEDIDKEAEHFLKEIENNDN